MLPVRYNRIDYTSIFFFLCYKKNTYIPIFFTAQVMKLHLARRIDRVDASVDEAQETIELKEQRMMKLGHSCHTLTIFFSLVLVHCEVKQ